MEEKAAEVVKVVAASMEVALAVLAVDGVAGVATTTATSTADERRAHRCWVAAHGSLIGDSVPSREKTGTLGLGQGERPARQRALVVAHAREAWLLPLPRSQRLARSRWRVLRQLAFFVFIGAPWHAFEHVSLKHICTSGRIARVRSVIGIAHVTSRLVSADVRRRRRKKT